MEISRNEIPKNLIYEELKKLFLEKGYPEKNLSFENKLLFQYQGLTFEITLDLLVKTERIPLILKYHPSKGGLSSFERPLLALTRIFFNPLPFYAVLTNLEHLILIEVIPQKIYRGDKEILPTFEALRNYQAPSEKPFNLEIERKILAFYLSGG